MRAIAIGRNGLGSTAPNPMVGCVIVHDNKIIGEGFTSAYGGPHAEVRAIASVTDKSMLRSATLYVTLEPCSHFGKTPPCSDLIIEMGIPRVMVGARDPNPLVSGTGIQRLQAAGVQVECGIMKNLSEEHHRRFLTFHQNKRPYIILKWAISADGFMAPSPRKREQVPQPYWISGEESRMLVHRWRNEEPAILTGTNTVLADNPELTTRLWGGPSPLRIILDRNLRIPRDSRVLNEQAPSLVFHGKNDSQASTANTEYQYIDFNADVAKQICQQLYERQILSLIVEGGKQSLETFIRADLWDEARVFSGQSLLGSGLRGPEIIGKTYSQSRIGNDTLNVLRND